MEDFTTSGDTSGGGTAVLDAPPASSSADTDSSTSVGTTSDADLNGDGGEHGSVSEINVPKPRFDEVNTKYQQLKWAERYRQQEIDNLVAFDRRFSDNPVAAYQWLGDQLRMRGIQIPQFSQGTQPAQTPASEQRQLGPDYQYVDPQTQQRSVWFSPERVQQILEAYNQRLDQRLGPLEQREASREMHFRAQQEATNIVAEAERDWPHFNDFREQIWQEMANGHNLESAYRRAVFPHIRDRERQTLLAELRDKSQATTASPSSAQPQGSSDLSKLSIQELFSREMRKRGMGR